MLNILAFDIDLVCLTALRCFAEAASIGIFASPALDTIFTKLSEQSFDAIFVAIASGAVDAQICSRVRSVSLNPNISIILVSDGGRNDLEAICQKWGADRYIYKPITPAGFQEVLGQPQEESFLDLLAEDTAPAAQLQPLQNGAVLIVDDDKATAAVLTNLIIELFPNVEISTAFDAVTGLSMAARHSPQLIILDHMMPNMDGKEFLRALRSHPCGQYLPVLAHSALNLSPVYEDEPMVEFLRKPATLEQLQAAIVRLWAKLK